MYERGKKIMDKQFPGSEMTYEEKLIDCVKNQMSGKQIAKEMKIDYSNMHRWLRKLGLNLPNYHNELKFDNTVFDTVDTEEKAYWLGFLYADGYVSGNGKTVELSLMGADIEHLKKFTEFLHHQEEVKLGTSKCNGKEFSRCRLTLTNAHFNESLVRLGCIPNKSLILKFPDVSIFSSEELIRHFIRGYVDGDGCITHTTQNRLEYNIVGTKEMLEGIRMYCSNWFPAVFHKDNRRPNSNTYSMINTCCKAEAFGEFLYKDATIYLQRKFNKFNELKR